jgi:hypothetical protein
MPQQTQLGAFPQGQAIHTTQTGTSTAPSGDAQYIWTDKYKKMRLFLVKSGTITAGALRQWVGRLGYSEADSTTTWFRGGTIAVGADAINQYVDVDVSPYSRLHIQLEGVTGANLTIYAAGLDS